MCVLIVKYPNIELPSKKVMNACMAANPHGFGFATPTKFFKTLDRSEFLRELYKIDVSEPCIIHCRWATHGSVKTDNCHPFVNDSMYFAHNGVLNIQSVNDMTDSQIFFNSVYPFIKDKGFCTKTNNLINKYRGSSRFAFLDAKTQTIYTFGEFTAIDGVLFSNTRWQAQMFNTKRVTRFANYYNDIF